MSKLKIPSDEHLAHLRQSADLVVPRDWRVKVRRHPCGEGVLALVTQAPVDLLQDLQDHGIPLNGCMSFPGTINTYSQYLSEDNALVMKHLWYALNDPDPVLGGDYYVALEIGSKQDPFIHVLPKPKKIKKLHPKVQAYVDHAKKVSAELAAQDAKKLFPAKAVKFVKQAKGNHSWA